MTMTHAAAGSHSPLEWLLVCAAAAVLVWALGAALRYTVRPEELDARHIGRRILHDHDDEPRR
jgi:hypothetical protein